MMLDLLVQVEIELNNTHREYKYKVNSVKQCSDNAQTISRLKRVEGQIRGLIGMVEEDRPYENILMQVTAAKAALHKAGQSLLESHLQHCILKGFKKGEYEETMDKLLIVLEQFSRLS